MFFVALTYGIYAQGSRLDLTNKAICFINSSGSLTEVAIQSSSNSGMKLCEKIMEYAHFPINFTLYATKQPGVDAFATIGGETGMRYVIYNENYLKAAGQSGNPYWTSVFVFAHEIGHHLANHTLSEGDNRKEEELAADYFAGYALGKMKESRYELSSIFELFEITPSDDIHPPRKERADAAIEGWNKAQTYKEVITVTPCTKTTGTLRIYNDTDKMIQILEVQLPNPLPINQGQLPSVAPHSEAIIGNVSKGLNTIRYSVLRSDGYREQAETTKTFEMDPCNPENRFVITK